eukprot:scaffold21812_cov110-Isochrysis_galbana.AAC.16
MRHAHASDRVSDDIATGKKEPPRDTLHGTEERDCPLRLPFLTVTAKCADPQHPLPIPRRWLAAAAAASPARRRQPQSPRAPSAAAAAICAAPEHGAARSQRRPQQPAGCRRQRRTAPRTHPVRRALRARDTYQNWARAAHRRRAGRPVPPARAQRWWRRDLIWLRQAAPPVCAAGQTVPLPRTCECRARARAAGSGPGAPPSPPAPEPCPSSAASAAAPSTNGPPASGAKTVAAARRSSLGRRMSRGAAQARARYCRSRCATSPGPPAMTPRPPLGTAARALAPRTAPAAPLTLIHTLASRES